MFLGAIEPLPGGKVRLRLDGYCPAAVRGGDVGLVLSVQSLYRLGFGGVGRRGSSLSRGGDKSRPYMRFEALSPAGRRHFARGARTRAPGRRR